jgi:hypothetical protein
VLDERRDLRDSLVAAEDRGDVATVRGILEAIVAAFAPAESPSLDDGRRYGVWLVHDDGEPVKVRPSEQSRPGTGSTRTSDCVAVLRDA